MEEKYTLHQLFRMGLISYKPIFYIEMVSKYNQLRATKVKKGEAVRQVALLSKVTTRTVYKALKLLNHNKQ